MRVEAIDHVNLRIPDDRIDDAVAFYGDALGFAIENRDLYESGEKPFFSARLAPGAVVHLRPDEAFTPPSGADFDHVALRFDADLETIKGRLEEHGVAVDRELTPLGATGTAPAVYVTDPFGYTLELKASG